MCTMDPFFHSGGSLSRVLILFRIFGVGLVISGFSSLNVSPGMPCCPWDLWFFCWCIVFLFLLPYNHLWAVCLSADSFLRLVLEALNFLCVVGLLIFGGSSCFCCSRGVYFWGRLLPRFLLYFPPVLFCYVIDMWRFLFWWRLELFFDPLGPFLHCFLCVLCVCTVFFFRGVFAG